MVGVSSTGAFRGGAGEPLVLIHIGANPWHKWEPVLPQLTAQYDVLVPTLPGWAGGAKLSGSVTLKTFVDAVADAMDAAGMPDAHLAGNSFGGWVAFELARRGRARSVLAFSPAGGWTPGGARRLRRFFVWNKRLTTVSRPFVSVALRFALLRRVVFRLIVARPERLTPDQATHLATDTMRGDLGRIAAGIFDTFVSPYPEFGVPTLLAWSELDRFTPLHPDGETWQQAASHAEWRILRGVGHLPMFDDPELVARTMLAHLDGATAAAAS
jgi:pimeloyl-ACP methyl ester carboxylesterase